MLDIKATQITQNEDDIKLSFHTIFKRFWARFKHLLRFREIINWKYESCYRCGSGDRLTIDVKDNKWIEVNGRYEGCLCLDCFIKIAESKNIKIELEDFTKIWIFNPEGNSFDIFKQ